MATTTRRTTTSAAATGAIVSTLGVFKAAKGRSRSTRRRCGRGADAHVGNSRLITAM